MSTSGITRPCDIVVKSIECYNRLIIDRNCDLNVNNAHFDSSLSVDIGGNINMPATTINFTNSTIDFTGASITGLTGNISGNLSFEGNVIAGGFIGDKFIGGDFCGENVIVTNTLTANNIVITNEITSDVCGNLTTNAISEKNIGGGIALNGILVGNFAGEFDGDTTGTHTGDITTNTISSFGNGITIVGILNGNLSGNFEGSGSGLFLGDFCGNASLNILSAKDSIAIIVENDLILADGNIISGNLCIDTLTTGNIESKNILNPISITPGIITPFLSTTTLSLISLAALSVIANTIISTIGCFDVLKAETITQSGISGTTFDNDVNFISDVCVFDLFVGNVTGKFGSEIFVKSNVKLGNNILFSNELCSNIVRTDILVGKNGPLNFDSILTSNVFANVLSTSTLTEQITNQGINVIGNIVIPEQLTTNLIIGNVGNFGNLCCANLIVDFISAKNVSTILVKNNIKFEGDLEIDGAATINTSLNVLGNTAMTLLDVDFATIDFLTTQSVVATNILLPIAMTGNVNIVGNVNTTESFLVDGIQIITSQQPIVNDASLLTAITLTDSTTGTANQIVENVSTTIGVVSSFVVSGSGGVSVISNASTDLDTTQSALATLTSQTNSALSSVDTRLNAINNNFADVTDEINKMIVDLASVHTQLNLALARLRFHGLIDS